MMTSQELRTSPLFENISYGLKVFYAGHMFQFLLDSLSVVVW